MDDRAVTAFPVLTVEAALAALPDEVAAAYEHDRRALRADIEARIAGSLASNRRFVAIEAETVAALADRVELGPRRRLATVGSLLESARAPAPAALLPRLTRARDLARRADVGLADLADGGFQRITDERGLREALAGIIVGLPPEVHLVLDLENTSGAVVTAAYFVVAEALSNVAKHASASHVTASVRRVGHGLVVEIADDGIGGADPDGPGLRGLAARVAEHGGRLEVTGGGAEGTTVRAVIPG